MMPDASVASALGSILIFGLPFEQVFETFSRNICWPVKPWSAKVFHHFYQAFSIRKVQDDHPFVKLRIV